MLLFLFAHILSVRIYAHFGLINSDVELVLAP